jgi:uncharacterized membrane protein
VSGLYHFAFTEVGAAVGAFDGAFVGLLVGAAVGDAVGESVGACARGSEAVASATDGTMGARSIYARREMI